jgi:hypothetical protein
VKAPVGIKVIVPPPAEIGAGAVIVTTAAVPEIKVIGAVGAIVAAEAIVGAAAVLATKPEYLTLVKVGLPVQLVKSPLAGVPNTGVTNVGLVANTSAPEPVSPVTAAAKLADEGVPKKVATPVPKLVMPVPPLATGKVPVTPVVKGKPVQEVSVPDAGVPKAGVINVAEVIVGVIKALLVNKLLTESCLVVLVAACTIGNTSALACPVATGNEEMAIVVIIDP